MIRLLAIDIDGTLLDSQGRLPPENRAAIEAAVAAGVRVTLVTGRSYPFARPVAEGLPDAVTLIVSNGAVERDREGLVVDRRLLPREVARAVLGRTPAYRHGAALIFDRTAARQLLYESMDWEDPNRKGYWERNQLHIEQCVPLESGLDEDPIQVMFNGPVARMRRLADEMAEGREGYALSLTEYEDRDFSLLDVTAEGATKAGALAAAAGRLGLDRAQVMAIAGCPVVMGNAVAPLRARGWPVTGGHDEAGVAQAIRRYILGE
jgi:hydroxymethylpyrimidine pyrophosphatase-like HAD family hydrolase